MTPRIYGRSRMATRCLRGRQLRVHPGVFFCKRAQKNAQVVPSFEIACKLLRSRFPVWELFDPTLAVFVRVANAGLTSAERAEMIPILKLPAFVGTPTP